MCDDSRQKIRRCALWVVSFNCLIDLYKGTNNPYYMLAGGPNTFEIYQISIKAKTSTVSNYCVLAAEAQLLLLRMVLHYNNNIYSQMTVVMHTPITFNRSFIFLLYKDSSNRTQHKKFNEFCKQCIEHSNYTLYSDEYISSNNITLASRSNCTHASFKSLLKLTQLLF